MEKLAATVAVHAGTDISRTKNRRELYETARKVETRRKLVAAARHLFGSDGYHETGPRDVASRAGMATGTFYLHFEDKLDCFLECVSEAAGELLATVTQYSASATTFPEMLEAMVRAIIDYSFSHPGDFRNVVVNVKLLSAGRRKAVTRQTQYFSVQTEKWKAMGEIEESIDNRLVAYLITGAISQGDVLVSHNPQNKEKVIRKISQFLTRGLAPSRACDDGNEKWIADAILRTSNPEDARLPTNGGAVRIAEGVSRKRRETSEKLLTAAKALFSERGYQDVGIEDIAARAGITPGTFYLYFKDKFDCFLAFTNEETEEFGNMVHQYITKATTFRESLYAMVRGTIDFSLANPGVLGAILADVNVLSKKKNRIINRDLERYVTCIEQWKKTGEVTVEFESKLIAYFIAGTNRQLDAFITRYPEKRLEAIESVTRFLLRAIGNTGH